MNSGKRPSRMAICIYVVVICTSPLYIWIANEIKVQITCGFSSVNSKPVTSVYTSAVKFLSEWVHRLKLQSVCGSGACHTLSLSLCPLPTTPPAIFSVVVQCVPILFYNVPKPAD